MGELSAPQIRRVLADNIVRFINLFTYLLTYLLTTSRLLISIVHVSHLGKRTAETN